MKKEYSILAFILITQFCCAQFPKGTKMMEWAMSGQYNSYSYEQYSVSGNSQSSQKDYNFTFYPSYNLFIKENLMLGFGPTYASVRNENFSHFYYQTPDYESNQKTNSYGLRLTLRKYNLIKDGFYWYYGFDAGYEHGIGTRTENSDNWDTKINTVLVNANCGFAYDLSKQWLLRGGIGNLNWTKYSSETKDDDGILVSKSENSSLQFSAIYLSFGLSYILHHE